MSAPSCETPPVSETTAVRGGLASTGKAPIKPAMRLAAPRPTKSRLTSGPRAGSETKLRVVAAVCTITTMPTIKARGAIWGMWSSQTLGIVNFGVAPAKAPSVETPRDSSPSVWRDDLTQIAPLALVPRRRRDGADRADDALRSLPTPEPRPDVNRDFVGVGAASALAGLLGAFPLNASPPRTAAVVESGGVSQLGSLFCAGLVLALLAFGAGLLTHVPYAALAGVLLFVAQRIVRLSIFADVWRRSFAEFNLDRRDDRGRSLFLPIGPGVGIGIGLSLLHCVWTTTCSQNRRIRPDSRHVDLVAEKRRSRTARRSAGTIVIAWQAPLSFLNVYDFSAAPFSRSSPPGRRCGSS